MSLVPIDGVPLPRVSERRVVGGDPASSPAPVGNDVTVAAMSTTALCQKPHAAGASGRNP
jgi:hypothetical protein